MKRKTPKFKIKSKNKSRKMKMKILKLKTNLKMHKMMNKMEFEIGCKTIMNNLPKMKTFPLRNFSIKKMKYGRMMKKL